MSDCSPRDLPLWPLAGGWLLSEITNWIVAFMRERHGPGGDQSQDLRPRQPIVCALSDGLTAIERTMVEGGEPERCARCDGLPADDESQLQRADRGAPTQDAGVFHGTGH